MDQQTRTLIIGGARSGKSQYAETLIQNHPTKIYLPTAQHPDSELKTRIKTHQARRDQTWHTIETPLDLADTITSRSEKTNVTMVDCLTLWLFNLLEDNRNIASETEKLIKALENAKGPVIMVTNEVGLSIVPENKLAREFRDAQGRLNQEIAKCATDVTFIAAGLPMHLKQSISQNKQNNEERER